MLSTGYTQINSPDPLFGFSSGRYPEVMDEVRNPQEGRFSALQPTYAP